ncbi:sugar phosphate nucleotidyltransferase [Thermodesulfobacteriota bacterium]
MKAGIILAAGFGSRLNGMDKSALVKPLVSVDGYSLLLRTIRSLVLAGCSRVVIVLGYEAKSVEAFILSHYKGPADLIFTFNERYQLQNGISVLCARPFVGKEFLITMADHILDDAIMCYVRKHRPPIGGATLCVDYKLDTIFDINDATKVFEQHGLIQDIGKKIDYYNCIDIGVFIGTSGLFNAIDQIYQEKGDASLSDGVQVLADEGKMETLDIQQAYWQDVDTPEMLEHAKELLRQQIKN